MAPWTVVALAVQSLVALVALWAVCHSRRRTRWRRALEPRVLIGKMRDKPRKRRRRTRVGTKQDTVEVENRCEQTEEAGVESDGTAVASVVPTVDGAPSICGATKTLNQDEEQPSVERYNEFNDGELIGNGEYGGVAEMASSERTDPHDQFWEACTDGNVETVLQLLKDGTVDVNKANDNGMSALLLALDNYQIVQLLLDHGAHINSDGSGDTALHVARDPRIIQMLLDANADPNATNWNGDTPLHTAVFRDTNPDKVTLLLEHGAWVHTANARGYAPIHLLLYATVKSGEIAECYDTGKALASGGAKWDDTCEAMISETGPSIFGFRVAMLWWIDEHARGIRELTAVPPEVLSRGPTSVEQYLAALHASAKVIFRRKVCVVGPSFWGKTSLVKSISSSSPSLEHPEDRTIGIDHFPFAFSEKAISDEALLLAACEDGDIETVRWLLETKRVDPRSAHIPLPDKNLKSRHDREAEHLTPLDYAVRLGRVDILQLLLDSGMRPIMNDEASTALGLAVYFRHAPALKALLVAGANPNPVGPIPPLLCALQGGFEEGARLLLQYGAHVNVADKRGHTPLHYCSYCLELASALLAANANIHATNQSDETPFHLLLMRLVASRSDVEELVRTLVKVQFAAQAMVAFGAHWDEKCEAILDGAGCVMAAFREAVRVWSEEKARGSELTTFPIPAYARSGTIREFISQRHHTHTPLRLAILQRKLTDVAALIAAGADVNETDHHGTTPLHLAIEFNFADGMRVLLDNGAHVNAADEDGDTPLHYSCDYPGLIPVLLEAGANIDASNNDGYKPIHLLVTAMAKECYLTFEPLWFDTQVILKAMVSNGATWDKKCDELVVVRDARLSGICEAIKLWMEEHIHGSELTTLPVQSCKRGARSVRQYDVSLNRQRRTFQQRAQGQLSENHYQSSQRNARISSTLVTPPTDMTDERHPEHICAEGESSDLLPAGPSGSTSTIFKPERERIDENCLSPVESRSRRYHEITFWDFAGQEAYQVAHSAYFSRRTLYLVCVDLQSYAAALVQTKLRADKDRDVDRLMSEFAESKILRWIRLILARQPDAEFVFIGTKADVLARKAYLIDEAHQDLCVRIKKFAQSIERKSCDADERLRRLHLGSASLTQQVKGKLCSRALDASAKRLQDLQWFTVDCTSQESIRMAREAIEQVIVKSNRSFQMPDLYSQVLNLVQKQRSRLAIKSPSDQVAAAFVEITNANAMLRRELPQQADNLPDVACHAILRTLHDIGDVLWLEDMGIDNLKNTVILHPLVLIEFVRQVVHHNHNSEVMTHATLKEQPFWNDLDPHRMFALKQLLQQFHLVVARGSDMKRDSDLIVPAYWRSKESALWLFLGGLLKNDPSFSSMTKAVCVQWEYHFTTALPDVVFDELIIASHWQEYERQVGPDWILYVEGDQFACRVVLSRADHTLERVLVIEAIGSESATTQMWGRFEHLCESLEQVLSRYKGIVVSRCVVDSTGTRHELDDLVEKRMLMPPSRVAPKPWLPPSLTWYNDIIQTRMPVELTVSETAPAVDSTAEALLDAEIKWANHLSKLRDIFPNAPTAILIHFLDSNGGDINKVSNELIEQAA